MAIDRATIRRGLSVAGISAIIGLLSGILALYTQASGIVGPIVSAKLKKRLCPNRYHCLFRARPSYIC